VIRMDLGLDLPLDGLEGRTWGRTAFTRVAGVFSQLRGLDAVILPALGQRCEGILSGLGGAKALGLQVKELLCDGFVFALFGFVERGFGTFKSRSCIPDQPTLGHAIGAQREWPVAGGAIKRLTHV